MYFSEFLVGVCDLVLQTLTLFQTKICKFSDSGTFFILCHLQNSHPYISRPAGFLNPYLFSYIHTHFQTKNDQLKYKSCFRLKRLKNQIMPFGTCHTYLYSLYIVNYTLPAPLPPRDCLLPRKAKIPLIFQAKYGLQCSCMLT